MASLCAACWQCVRLPGHVACTAQAEAASRGAAMLPARCAEQPARHTLLLPWLPRLPAAVQVGAYLEESSRLFERILDAEDALDGRAVEAILAEVSLLLLLVGGWSWGAGAAVAEPACGRHALAPHVNARFPACHFAAYASHAALLPPAADGGVRGQSRGAAPCQRAAQAAAASHLMKGMPIQPLLQQDTHGRALHTWSWRKRMTT